jgi:hypothetical protein
LRARQRDPRGPAAEHRHGDIRSIRLQPLPELAGQRHPEVAHLRQPGAAELRIGDADDGRRLAVHSHDLPDDVVDPAKGVLPDVMTDDDHEARRAALRFFPGETSAFDEANAERVEVVRRHDRGASRMTAVVVRQGDSLKVHGRDLQRRALFLEMREHAMPGVRFDVAVFRHPAERREAGGMNASRRFGDDAVSDREDRRIAADHQGNQNHGRGADRRRLRQDPAPDAEILRQLFERRRNPDRPSVLFRERDIAERAPGGGLCVCRRQAAFRLKPSLLGQMEADLVIQLAIRSDGKKQRALNPHSKPAPR